MNLGAGEADGADDRLPWLETVEDDYQARPSMGRMVLLGALILILILAACLGLWWYQHQRSVSGNGELINAQEGDYKVKPDEPGGMKVEGEGDTVFATSQGAASNASINVGALPEAPVEGRAARQPAATSPGTKTATLAVPSAASSSSPRKPAAAPPSPKPLPSAGAGALIQLGAFPNEGGANIAWTRLSKRFGYLAPLGKSVEKAESNGKTVWRLRVNAGSNSQARELCGKLKVAGENCFVAN